MKRSKDPTQPSPKRECHKCPLNGKGDDYCWKVCLGPADGSGESRQMSRQGVSKVSISNMPTEGEYLNAHAVAGYGSHEFAAPEETTLPAQEAAAVGWGAHDRRDESSGLGASVSGLNFEVERGLVKVLATVFALTDVELCILRHVYNGESMTQAGRSLHKKLSKQAVSKHLYHMRDSDPVLGKVIRSLVRLDGTGGAKSRKGGGDRSEAKTVAQLQLDFLTQLGMVDAGNGVCTNVTRTRASAQCTPTRRVLSR